MIQDQKKPVLLIVEDNLDELQILIEILEKNQYKILVSRSGEDAIKTTKKIIPDLVLLDVVMTGIDGFETCKKLKQNPKTRAIPVIFITSLSDTTNKIKGFEVGGVDYITKPIQHEEFLARINTQLKLRNMQKELINAEKMKSIGFLTSGIAHDFNNILSIILGNIQLLKDEFGPTELITSTENAISRATNLSDRLISIAKDDKPFKEIGNIIDLIKESVEFVLFGSNIECIYNICDDLWPVFFDKNQLKQVFNHLILNADLAMPNGGQLTINVENYNHKKNIDELLLKKGKYIKITVKDTGCGIDEENIDHIFDPFFSTRDRGNQKGMGLGLTSAYFIIQKHDGYINVKSIKDKGTIFYIYLPADINEQSKTKPKNYIRKKSKNNKILVMDDEKMMRDLIKTILQKHSYIVDLAKDGEQVIEKYQKSLESGYTYDAVILDLTIKGGMGGYETFKELKRIDPEVKAIISSGYHDDPVIDKHKSLGFKDALIKPYRKDEIKKKIIKTLESK